MDQGFGKEVLTLEDLEKINDKIDEKNNAIVFEEEPVEESTEEEKEEVEDE